MSTTSAATSSFSASLIQQADRDGLLAYGKKCIDVLYANIVHFNRPITTISLVQGDALGGGFEAALSSDVLIAEKGTQMGFPEILFNLFPGMGAFSILSRKLDPKRAERMILSGNLYSAEELHDMGLVDILADKGDGEMAVYDYIRRENRARNGFRAVREVRDAINPITYDELLQIVEIWVDTALKLEARDLRMMERLVARQKTRRRQGRLMPWRRVGRARYQGWRRAVPFGRHVEHRSEASRLGRAFSAQQRATAARGSLDLIAALA